MLSKLNFPNVKMSLLELIVHRFQKHFARTVEDCVQLFKLVSGAYAQQRIQSMYQDMVQCQRQRLSSDVSVQCIGKPLLRVYPHRGVTRSQVYINQVLLLFPPPQIHRVIPRNRIRTDQANCHTTIQHLNTIRSRTAQHRPCLKYRLTLGR
jgi:hypothetical protein